MFIRTLMPTLLGALMAISAMPAGAAASAGETIASSGNGKGATPCLACHGAKGEGNDAAGYPRLAGLPAAYIETQLAAFADGSRDNALMTQVAKALGTDEAKQVADYYSGLDTPAAVSVPTGATIVLARGKQLATLGSWQDRSLPACDQCHGPDGKGVGDAFPPLYGQPAQYVANQIAVWKKGERPAGPLGLMESVAEKLTPEEAADVAAYYALLANDPDQAAGLQPTDPAEAAGDGFKAAARSHIADDPFGESVRRGEQVYLATNTAESSKDFVGNQQQCADCHMDAGRLADSAPMWAAWPAYPAYRGKNKKVNTFIERIQGCYNYSMNAQGSVKGHVPGADDPAIVDLISYFYWMSQGTPTGAHDLPGRGYPKVAEPAQGFDPARGEVVYQRDCAVCHGADGEGQLSSGAMGGAVVFPPLWGQQAYNWGAGMHGVNKAAGFIQANMPLGLGGSLSDQDAWDVSAWINSKPRPQDPRFDGDLEKTKAAHHAGKYDYYGDPALILPAKAPPD